MKALSIIALVMFVSASSFAQTGEAPAANGASAQSSAPAPKAEKSAKKEHKKKHSNKK